MSRIYRRADRWYVDYIDAGGRRVRKSVGRSRRQAEEILRKLELGLTADAMGLETGKLEGRPRLTVKELIEQWIEKYSMRHKRSWKHDVIRFKTHVLPKIGEMAAASVTKKETTRILDDMFDAGKAPATRRQVYQLLGQAFRWGIEQGLVEQDPTLGVRKPRLIEKPVDNYLSRSESARLLARSPASESVVYATAIYSGLRLGELCALRWDDLDFDNRLIYVKKSHDAPSPKSKKERVVSLHPELGAILRRWRMICPETSDGLCFPNPEWVKGTKGAKPQRSRFSRYGFEKNLQAAGITRHVTFHTLRHTSTSLLIMAGASRDAVQKAMGHSSPLVTERYMHLSPGFIHGELGKLSLDPIKDEPVMMKLAAAGSGPPEGGDQKLIRAHRRHKSGTTRRLKHRTLHHRSPEGGGREEKNQNAGMAKLVDARDLKS